MNSLNILAHCLQLEIVSHSAELLGTISRHYRSYDNRQAFSERASKFTFFLDFAGSEFRQDIAKFKDGVFAKFSLSGYPCYFEGGVFLCTDNQERDGHAVEINTMTRTVRANLGQRFCKYEECLIFEFMRDVLHKLVFPLSQLLPLHAAAVTKNGSTTLLSGDKAMGKTTLSLRLHERGYAVLGDDSPLLALHQGKTVALSSIDPVSVTEETLALFPALRGHAERRREISGKYTIDRQYFHENQSGHHPSPVTHFVQLNRLEYGEARMRPIDKMDVLSGILKQSMILFQGEELAESRWGLAKANQFVLNALTQLIADAKCFSLESPFDQISEAAQLIEELDWR